MMPLIDVIFLILTFFIYAMVLMVRIEVLPVPMESYAGGEAAEPSPAVTLTIALDGQVFVDREPVALEDVLAAVRQRKAMDPETTIYIVMADGEGTVDRGPVLTALWDSLKDAGLEIGLVGAPNGE